jgi:hypothetical protein
MSLKKAADPWRTTALLWCCSGLSTVGAGVAVTGVLVSNVMLSAFKEGEDAEM